MFIKDTSKLDLGTIDLSIELGNKIIAKIPLLKVDDDAKKAWEHEMKASNERLAELKPGYTDGRTTARNYRDQFIMLMHVQLTQQFMSLLEKKDGNEAHAGT